ncbi:MAG: Endoribonuclease L-PSP [Parcubacteria group bacterium GW2011_GWA2_49_9]|nr:MAG: Endoribonuclease L-PSP [Parcubacteria group bacterium GW2011_GWA2_49_9]
MRKKIVYNQPLEKQIGFSRAVRVGNIIAVSGTAPIAVDGSVTTPGDVYGQTKRCLEIIKDVIEKTGGNITDVIRTRIFLTDIEEWKKAAEAHGEYFSETQPACTFVEVSRFIHPEWLIEIEADAVISPDNEDHH